MEREALTSWALRNGWQEKQGVLSLVKPRPPHEAIVRLVFKASVAQIEVKKPAGKWEKIASAPYAQIIFDEDQQIPRGLGFERIPSFSMLMQENKDMRMFDQLKKNPNP